MTAWVCWNGGDARAASAAAPASEYEVKAAFLCKFGAFVQWPPEAFDVGTQFVIAVAGDDDVKEEVSKAAVGLQVEGRPILVRVLRRGDPIAGVHVLFVARSAERYLREWLAAARHLPVLTVTESDQGLSLGSSVNFVVVDNKVRFDVAPPPPDPPTIKVDSRLLGVARKVVARAPS